MAAHSTLPQDVVEIPEVQYGDGINNNQNPLQSIWKTGSLAAGACGYRDPFSGVTCGCGSFWLVNASTAEIEPGQENCACGHHACFHTSNTVLSGGAAAGIDLASNMAAHNPAAEVLQHLKEVGRLLSTIMPDEGGQRALLPADRIFETLPPTDLERLAEPTNLGAKSPFVESYQQSFTNLLAAFDPIGPMLQPPQDVQNQNNATGLGVLLPMHEAPEASNNAPGVERTAIPTIGDSFTNSPAANSLTRLFQAFNPGPRDPNMPSTIGGSAEVEDGRHVQTRTETIFYPQPRPTINVRDLPPPTGFQDIMLSATDIATPSVGRSTPDCNSIPPAIIKPAPEAKTWGAKTAKLDQTREMPPPDSRVYPLNTARLLGKRDGRKADQVLTPSSQSGTPPPLIPQDPSSLRELAHHMNALRNFVTRHDMQFRGVFERLDAAETTHSFSQPPRDQDLFDKVDGIETRIIEIEGHVDQHSKLLADVDVEANDDHSRKRKRFPSKEGGDGSVISEQSGSNDSGSSVIAALPEEQHSIKDRINDLEERMTEIERHLPPSTSRPLTIEVILLPWGRDLRGLWVQPEGPKASSSRYTTQDREEWTTSQDIPSAVRMASYLRADSESGWSSQAIHGWASDSDQWLVPRACGAKSVVYHRLKSRGFVHQVVLTKPGARELQDAIVKTFGGLLPMVSSNVSDDINSPETEADDDKPTALGLEAQFIPLRKIPGVSKLRFLTKSEMVTPALWTYEFLMSGVIMRTAGGPRRLFITHKEGYLQRSGEIYPSWTWEKIKQLNRPGSIGEIDERTWTKHSILDVPPISLNTSFASQQSATPPRSVSLDQPLSGNNQTGELITPNYPTSTSNEARSDVLVSKGVGPITPITNPPGSSTQEISRMIGRSFRSVTNLDIAANAYGVARDDARSALGTTEVAAKYQPFTKSSAGEITSQDIRMAIQGLFKRSHSPSNPSYLGEPSEILSRDETTRLVAEDLREDDHYVDSHDVTDALSQDEERQHERYNFRRLARTVSNPVKSKNSEGQVERRSFSASTTIPAGSSRRTHGFEKISNPVISHIPSFVPNQALGSNTKQRGANPRAANKRRRLSSYMSYDDGQQSRRQRSTSASFIQSRSSGKRAITPIGHYPTPHSGNFHDPSSPVGVLSQEVEADEEKQGNEHRRHETDDEEAWEGVGEDGEEHFEPKGEIVVTIITDSEEEV
jgi:hypothetical protein